IAETIPRVDFAEVADLEGSRNSSLGGKRGHLCTKLAEKLAHLNAVGGNGGEGPPLDNEVPCKCSFTLFRERIHLLKILEIRHAHISGYNHELIPLYAHEYKNQTIAQMLPNGNAAIRLWRSA